MSDFHTDIDTIRMVSIKSVIPENPKVKTFYFEDRLSAEGSPGQFLMVWIPGVDEIPLSLSTIGPKRSASMTVKMVGEATEALHRMGEGNVIGVRGPYGVGFTPIKGRVMVVAGGLGMAPLYPLVRKLHELGSEITLIIGAKSMEELLFMDRIQKEPVITGEFIATTEDGTYGIKGVASEVASLKLREMSYDTIYTCGPEQMMLEIYKLSKIYGNPAQILLERYMRCGFGICGSCGIGKFRICRDGPVLSTNQLREVDEEFGKVMLDRSGRRVKVRG